ncbi:MAG TPA: ATP-dependent helicase HrpB, partial [Longimicrobiales bacterium]|nr:ATP-dependent helicase HrpB [Longimicrobiales bacterium]
MLLPIDDVLPDLLKTLRADTSAVLQAPPGAGKTTRVPVALLQESWLNGRRIVMLEPRRLAARAAASFMARSLGEAVGETVGYRIRFDTRVGPRTRIEVVTEGVLTRLLQDDPALEAYGIVIFDEFHERSIYADTGLALALQARALLRDDLRVLVMSATLQGEPIAQLLGNAKVITGTGRSFPVETSYLERPRSGYIEPLVAQYVRRALADHDGDVLVFLPGAAEIRRTQEQLDDVASATTAVLPLYGNLTQAEQDRAIAPSPRGQRKVVLATSIAETSLTIEGVRVVVDSGLMRVPRFDVRTGMTRLDTVTVTKASAEQRCGRAGRVAPGFCYRLWTAHEQSALVPHGTPEILEADLVPLALDLAAWGTTDPNELPWLDAPPASAYAQARELLLELGGVDAGGNITGHGRRIARLPVHPRLGHMLLRAQELKCAALACDMAALLGERDIMRGA